MSRQVSTKFDLDATAMKYLRQTAPRFCGQVDIAASLVRGSPEYAGCFGVEGARHDGIRSVFWPPGYWYTIAVASNSVMRLGDVRLGSRCEQNLCRYLNWWLADTNSKLIKAANPSGSRKFSTRVPEANAWGVVYAPYLELRGYPSKWEPHIRMKINASEVRHLLFPNC